MVGCFEIHAILSGTWNRSSHVLVVIENLLLIPVESVEYLQVRRLVSLRIFMVSGMYQLRILEAVQYMAPSLKSHHLYMNIFTSIYIYIYIQEGVSQPQRWVEKNIFMDNCSDPSPRSYSTVLSSY